MDLSRFRRAAIPLDWRRILGVPDGGPKPPVVLMMAAFEPRKRHVEFLAAFSRVARDVPETKLVLAGQGPELAQVRSAAHRFGIADQVVFCGHRSDPEALFALADLSVLTSTREGLPRVAVQSIASGCPMLVQKLPGIDEIICNGRNGYILPADDMDAVTARMVHLLRRRSERLELRKGALATDVSAWALETLGERTTALYARVAASDKRRAA